MIELFPWLNGLNSIDFMHLALFFLISGFNCLTRQVKNEYCFISSFNPFNGQILVALKKYHWTYFRATPNRWTCGAWAAFWRKWLPTGRFFRAGTTSTRSRRSRRSWGHRHRKRRPSSETSKQGPSWPACQRGRRSLGTTFIRGWVPTTKIKNFHFNRFFRVLIY